MVRTLSSFAGVNLSSEIKKMLILETKWCILLAERNLPISFIDSLVPMFKLLFPNDPVVEKLRLGRTKATSIIRQGKKLFLFYD